MYNENKHIELPQQFLHGARLENWYYSYLLSVAKSALSPWLQPVSDVLVSNKLPPSFD